jgi:hypothetical protein
MSAGIGEIGFLIWVFRSSSPLTGVWNTLLLTKPTGKNPVVSCLANVEAKAL